MDSFGDSKSTKTHQPPCPLCSKLISALLVEEDMTYSVDELEPGSMKKHLKGTCQLHACFLKPFLDLNSSWNLDPGRLRLAFRSQGPNCLRIMIHDTFPWESAMYSIEYDRLGVVQAFKRPRLATEWIDVDLIKCWKDTCMGLHSECEKNPFSSAAPEVRPHFLIDTQDMCLRQSKPGDRYIALSYVWGQSAALKTCTSNLSQHQELGIFLRKDIASHIPNTVSDAINLAKLLKERFIWIDALCIVQDNDELRTHQLNLMATIYANAKFTIVAANGLNADHGLRGIKKSPRPVSRENRQHKVTLPNGMVIVERQKPLELYEQEWNLRGWTFQEGLVSTRKLLFIDNEVQWQCRCDHWEEMYHGSVAQNCYPRQLQRTHSLFTNPWPDFAGYQSLILDYHARKFTYPDDIYDAFVGITTVLSTTALGTFNHGLPELYFDAALLWCCRLTGSRKVFSNPRRKIPSWSWMGWETKVLGFSNLYPVINAGEVSVYKKLTPIVRWYSLSTTTGTKRNINSSLEFFRRYHNARDDESLPTGWRWDLDVETKIFLSALAPGVKFAYPIPLKHEYGPSCTTASEVSDLIWCRAQRCWLFLGAWVDPVDSRSVILDEGGTIIGKVEHAPNHPAGTTFPVCFEMVAISIQSNDPFQRGNCNVLMIEWVDGIAYRKGLGFVRQDAWEVQKLEWIDLTLG